MQWLIDGHNLIGQMPDLRLDDPDDEAKLVEYLRSYRARTGHRVTAILMPEQATAQPKRRNQVG